jgi:nanoRNase/pAp phosphatase (c-di-AMP/oligoRNAs hydrolase)
MTDRKYRLVTRSDFDGLVCAALLKEMDLIDEIMFVHPKDMQDGKIQITDRDITTNLPYVDGCHMAFDHHLSESIRVGQKLNHIIRTDAPSAARVVYDHFGHDKFPHVSPELMTAVDKADSARFSMDDVLDPQGWDLLNFLMDARTGLGRFRTFKISNYQLMMNLIDLCRTNTITEILEVPDIKERVQLYREQFTLFKAQLERTTTLHGKLAVTDLRGEDPIHAGNRFIVYALNPTANISIQVMWGREKQNTVLTVGKSIFDRSSPVNVGALCLEYGGGGHEAAGTCQVENEHADATLAQLVDRITRAG